MSNSESQKAEIREINTHLSLLKHGVTRCALRDRQGMAYKIPRLNIPAFLKDQKEQYNKGLNIGKEKSSEEYRRKVYCIDKSCLYLLVGFSEDENHRTVIYVGETDDVCKRRFSQHHASKKKSWPFQHLLIFCRADYDFNKGIMQHVERKIQELLLQQDTIVDLINGREEKSKSQRAQKTSEKTLAQSNLGTQDQQTADEFIKDVITLTKALGSDIFEPEGKDIAAESEEPEIASTSDETRFYMKRNGSVFAIGKPVENGFIVFNKSKMVDSEKDYIRPSYKALREKLREEGVVVDDVFTRDYQFSSPTLAASVIWGASRDGHTAWKNDDNVMLGKWLWRDIPESEGAEDDIEGDDEEEK
jgi:hypothetical protein